MRKSWLISEDGQLPESAAQNAEVIFPDLKAPAGRSLTGIAISARAYAGALPEGGKGRAEIPCRGESRCRTRHPAAGPGNRGPAGRGPGNRGAASPGRSRA